MQAMPTEPNYLLDTNILSLIFRGTAPLTLQSKISQTLPTHCFICSVTIQEMMKGRLAQISKAEDPKFKLSLWKQHELFVRTFQDLHTFQALLYDEASDRVFAAMSNAQRRKGVSDCRIAACAISHGYVLVTHNTNDFTGIPGLTVEDWTIEPASGFPQSAGMA